MTPLIDIRESQALTSGLFPDVPENQQMLWKDGENILFEDNAVKKAPGWSNLASFGTEYASCITQGYAIGALQTFVAQETQLKKWDGTSLTTLGSGFSSSLSWDLETWGNWLIATNGIDPPQVWKGSGAVVPLGGLSGYRTSAKLLAKLANSVFLFNTNSNPDEYLFSSQDDPETWQATADNTAGQKIIRDLDSEIVCVRRLGDALAVYTQSMQSSIEFLGVPYQFGDRVRQTGVGAVGKDSVVAVGNVHYGLDAQGFWRGDFSQVDRAFATPAVRNWVNENLLASQLFRIRAFHWRQHNLVMWTGFNLAQLLGTTIAFNYVTNSWTRLFFPVSAFLEQDNQTYPLCGFQNYLGNLGLGHNSNSSGIPSTLLPVNSSLRTGFFDAGAPTRQKFWDMLEIESTNLVGLQVRFGYATKPVSSKIEWESWRALQMENWIGRESPYLVIGFQDGAVVDTGWAIGGLRIHGEVTGYI